MDFRYCSYQKLLDMIRDNGYSFTDYEKYKTMSGKVCILRHDIDNSIEMAHRLSLVESEKHICSTWFVLMSSDFYNPASRKNRELLLDMINRGHQIGLHFDEMAWKDNYIKRAEEERRRLEDSIGSPVKVVSMHRPSKKTLEENWKFENMINSYSEEFFKGFKYVSDSRRRWREPVEEIVQSGKYERLHVLTHAFWYHNEDVNLHDTVLQYICSAKEDRYNTMRENITDIDSIINIKELFENK